MSDQPSDRHPILYGLGAAAVLGGLAVAQLSDSYGWAGAGFACGTVVAAVIIYLLRLVER